MTRIGNAQIEHNIYEDTGCALHPKCLECPRPRCVYDDPVTERANIVRNENRNQQIIDLYCEGRISSVAIAFAIGIKPNSVANIVRRWRAANPEEAERRRPLNTHPTKWGDAATKRLAKVRQVK